MSDREDTHSITDAPLDQSTQVPSAEKADKSASRLKGAGSFTSKWKWIAAIFFLLATSLIFSFLLDTTVRQQIVTRILGSGQTDEDGPPVGRELSAGLGQHFFIALPISKCFPDTDITKTNVSSTVVGTLMLGLQPLGNYAWNTRGDFKKEDPEPSLKLTNLQTTVLVLSDAITRARTRFDDSATLNKSRMEFYQWVLIALGALTTIFISLKSILNERTPGFVLIGVLAVVFSALSTACSSMISFYTPNDSFVRSDRTLTQLRQLHNDVSLFVAGVPDICASNSPESDETKKTLKELAARLAEIVNVSGGSGQGQSSGGNAGQTGPK